MEYKFEEFTTKLQKKFEGNCQLITEDLVRHWFINTINKQNNVFIEYPYRLLDGKVDLLKGKRNRVDLYYEDEGVVIEFKYHKKLSTCASCTTDNFGYVLSDLNRLSLLNHSHKLLVYVFDKQMYDYYKKVNAPLILEANCGENSTFTSKFVYDKFTGTTFCKSAFSNINKDEIVKLPFTIRVVYSNTIVADKFYLRVYEVINH